MNYGPLIFLAAFLAISGSWLGLVLTPQLQLGTQTQGTNTVATTQLYPNPRPGLATEGLDVYRANGCMYCHSQSVRQTGTAVNVILSDAGTNPVAVVEALIGAGLATNANPQVITGGLPKTVLRDVPMSRAKSAVEAVSAAGAKARVEIQPVGPDIARAWGIRRSISLDYLYDYPVMIGSLRAGPDLANVGARLPDTQWHFKHLYAPSSVVSNSPMPAYRYLFEQRKITGGPSPDALHLPESFAPPAGMEIVPRPEARALVAYLQSLQAGVPVFEAPVSVPPPPEPATNAVAASTNAPAS